MRKTATFRELVIDTAEALTMNPLQQAALEELFGEPVARSESARLDQLASPGALMVDREAKEKVHSDLAHSLVDEPGPAYRQPAMGAPILGETDEDLEQLFEAFDS
jgi:hypothetical protein